MTAVTPHTPPYYYVPHPSRHPVMAAFGLFFVIFGASFWINGHNWGKYSLLLGLLWFLVVLFQWFKEAIHENRAGYFGRKINFSYRWSMSWFIFSEVMFFGAFFTALWWTRVHSLPQLGSIDNALLWPDFQSAWPTQRLNTASPGDIIAPFGVMHPFIIAPDSVWNASFLRGIWETLLFSLPTVNTALLLSSGVTITIAHHALMHDNRAKTIRFMWVTVSLGLLFLCLQAYEYGHAYHEMNLKLSSGVYGSTFFMLTGFHGFHVFVGMLMLFFITLRLRKGDFDSKHHFGFEGAAWYWHFVDVVWLGLYTLVYCL